MLPSSLSKKGGHWPPFFVEVFQSARPAVTLFRIGLFFLFLGPLVPNHYLPWAAFHADAVSIMGFGLMCAAWHMQAGVAVWPTSSLLALAVAVIPLAQAASHLVNFWGDAWVSCAYVLLFALAIALGCRLAKRAGADNTLTFAAFALVLSAVASAGIAFEQWLRLDGLGIFTISLGPGGRPYGNAGQPNQLATWLVLGMIAAYALHHMRLMRAPSLVISTAFLVWVTSLTQSRAAWIEIALFVSILLAMRKRVALRASRWMIAFPIVCLLLASLTLPAIDDAMLLNRAASVVDRSTTGGVRLIHWASLLDALHRRPVFGYGWNQVSVAQFQVAAEYPATGEFIEHSHSILLDLLVWNGVPIGSIIVALAIYWLVSRLLAVRNALSLLSITAVIAVVAHGMVEFPLDYAYFLLPVGLLVGAVDALHAGTRFFVMKKWLNAGIVVFAAGLLSWIAADYLEVEDNVRALRFEFAGFNRGQPPSAAPEVLLLTEQREFLRMARATSVRGMTDERIDWMKSVAERFPYPPILLRYALANGLNGRPQQAHDTMMVLCKIHKQARCDEGLNAWHQMAANQYPELAQVVLPAASPASTVR